ncbi:unnamed protein product [Rangifer tarandus platyrhynchus]|uniref:Uncharacterized protein n=2 Tax=Rangifer tarandus platyrhynchus TaxID=3082113 RepID=A0ABN8ZNL5_RANTA|nr:unnamed protein product [Rangifer tarandus platyrhynchus]
MKLRDTVDALKVTDIGSWQVCVHPSGRGLWKQTLSVHLHAAHIPAHDPFGGSEKHGAADILASWAAEVVMSVQHSSLLQCHLHISICSSMQACVSVFHFLHFASHLIPLTSGLTLIL